MGFRRFLGKRIKIRIRKGVSTIDGEQLTNVKWFIALFFSIILISKVSV